MDYCVARVARRGETPGSRRTLVGNEALTSDGEEPDRQSDWMAGW